MEPNQSQFAEHCDAIDEAKERAQMRELLKRAADSLHAMEAELNGDMNSALGSEIERFLAGSQ